ncbi:MAG TPA: folate hydrolase, partial [Cyclobacteriaceae bacterium]
MKNHQLAIFCIVLTLISYKSVSQDRILGFSQASSDAQKALEKKFDEMVTPSNLDQWMKKLAARPHHVGSPYGKENAEFMTALFRQWGFETEIETFQVLFPTPKLRSLEMIAPSVYKAGLEEPALKEDVATNQKKEQLPPYNGYSIDGDVT